MITRELGSGIMAQKGGAFLLQDPVRMRSTEEMRGVVDCLVWGMKGLRATDAKELPRFRLEWGASIPSPRLEKPVGASFKIRLVKPDVDQAGWSEVYLRELLTAYAAFVCTQAVCRRWRLASIALSYFGEFDQPGWSEGQLKAMLHKPEYERYQLLKRGLVSFKSFLVGLFVLCAMKKLMRVYGGELEDGGLSYFREAVRWIFSEEGSVLLALRLTQGMSEEETSEGRMYSAPRDELERLVREVSVKVDQRLRVTHVMGVDLEREVAFESLSQEGVNQMLDDTCDGLRGLLVKESDISNFLSVVRLRGSTYL